jgi:hypothetical protein
MARVIHFRMEGVGNPTLSQTTACREIGFNTSDTDAVTCLTCTTTEIYTLAALRHREVVDALSSPKEHHTCLTPRSSITSAPA